ncbi:hypothetical protein BJ085DRAFT_13597 [Dimargaris cristalligena]|uniref:Matrin-type domain-containing protein n=1 Tax=Dimargaris cristalligena TaxID=215637 RepID=A0A4P9ZS09_9FUNG|nr:hypothetical protein BJ085DRAFT_13597 [Dimargaris cristalligena]|eukprot:RKP36314.1 hypothetical protein BJ085DRAFT_13597 [Dimargaris cristalligena]
MDMQNRVGSKPGSGGVAGGSESNVARRERLRQLALETIDLAKDPYFMRNHLGSYECKLCLTLHTNEGSYLAHTQGKKHQTNLARRAAREAKDSATTGPDGKPRRSVIKVGRPGYEVTQIYDPVTRQRGILFHILYPEIGLDVVPRHRFMSAFEQHVEEPNKDYQYVVFAAEPYYTIAFKVPSREVDKQGDRFFTYWDPDLKKFTLQFQFKNERTLPSGRPGHFRQHDKQGSGAVNPLNPYQAPSIQPTYINK